MIEQAGMIECLLKDVLRLTHRLQETTRLAWETDDYERVKVERLEAENKELRAQLEGGR